MNYIRENIEKYKELMAAQKGEDSSNSPLSRGLSSAVGDLEALLFEYDRLAHSSGQNLFLSSEYSPTSFFVPLRNSYPINKE